MTQTTKTTQEFNLIDHFDTLHDFKQYVKNIKSNIKFYTSKKIRYGNVPLTFDIETTSFYSDGVKCSIMYAFTFGFNGHSYLGRTWEEFLDIYTFIYKEFELNDQKRLIIYVQNLSYEFQFIYKRILFSSVFAIASRTPIKALTINGIEFRCSYILSGYSLDTIGKHLHTYKVLKMTGDLDYRLMRHSKTPLTDKEKGYILNDGLVVMAYIQEQIDTHKGNITKIPLTKTGEIRNLCRKNCLYAGKNSHKQTSVSYNNYRSLMLGLSIRSLAEYQQLRERAFYGGFTHSNAFYNNVVVKNVTSFDFISAYPYVMVAEKYPVGKCYHIKIKDMTEFERYIKNYCCMFDVEFINLTDLIKYEHPISASHCTKKINIIEDNGRVVSADILDTTLTEQDYLTVKEFYSWDKMYIKNFRCYRKEYLPTPFVKTILDIYTKKTELKGVAGMEQEYQHAKELLNSCYGMTVTDILREEIVFNGTEWGTKQYDSIEEATEDQLKKLDTYNKKNNRFLAYQWGIWVTAYNRRNLFTAIRNAGMNYVYSDTDSVKVKNGEQLQPYIDEYNNNVIRKLKLATAYHKIPFELCTPKTIKGDVKILGIWENETKNGLYTRFKTLGAKRYMTEQNDEISLTVSGINKHTAIPYLKTLKKDLFDLFTEDMEIKGKYTVIEDGKEVIKTGTGKNIHTYLDYEQDGVLVDYLGNKNEYHELSSVHMEESDYNLTYSTMYIEYLLSLNRKDT